jgi:hypothetical protein
LAGRVHVPGRQLARVAGPTARPRRLVAGECAGCWQQQHPLHALSSQLASWAASCLDSGV